jgi:hypothetical protein
MIGWNEDNFLERLAPQLRQKSGRTIGPCPDAETLLAVIEGEARELERVTVIEHLSHCVACAEIRSRLLNFESVSPTEPEAVWNHTQIRLDNWLEAFLRSEAARSRPPKGAKPSRRLFGWEIIPYLFTSGRIGWALGVAIALVLIAVVPLLLQYRREQFPQVQVAARATVPPKPPAIVPPSETPPEESTEKPNIAPRKEGLRQAGANYPTKAKTTNKPKASGSIVQSTPAPAPSTEPGRITPAAPIIHVPTLRLDPAGRLLIVLSSISFKPDAGFQFHAIVLLPVAQAGRAPLDKGTEVIGVGTRSQGQISLAITDFVVQGVRYTLKEGNGVMNAETPGAGGGVHFDRSQLLDMRPTASAVYEKVSGQLGHPEAQK